MIKEAVEKLKNKKDLKEDQLIAVFNQIMDGVADKADVKEFLTALKSKGESIEEIVAAAKVMRERMLEVKTNFKNLMDTCGTGGAEINDVNTSTVTALVLAGCGVKIAKHGNRSFSHRCGSTDIMEALGVRIKEKPEDVAGQIERIGFGFMHAPYFHPAMKNVANVRKELRTKTIFNILGPLSNPAGAKMQLLGVYKPELTEIMAEALEKLGSQNSYVVHGLKGVDEISIEGETKISVLEDGRIETRLVKPRDFGLKDGVIGDIRGGDAEHNKRIILDILEGKRKDSCRNMVLMNASAGLKIAGMAKDFRAGVELALDCIDSGRALNILDRLRS